MEIVYIRKTILFRLVYLSICILCLLQLHNVAALYSDDDGVTILNESNFEKLVLQSHGASIVEFYAPWCGHCQKLSSQYKKLAKNLKGTFTVGAVDCDEYSNKNLCVRYGIQQFPTIKFFPPTNAKEQVEASALKDAITYPGPLTTKGISDSAAALLTDELIVYLRNVQDLEAYKESRAGLYKVLLVTSKDEASTAYRGLSFRLQKHMAFAFAGSNAQGISRELNLGGGTAVLVFKPDGQTVQYSGEVKGAPLAEFLMGLVPEEQNNAAGSKLDETLPALNVSDLDALDVQEDMHLLVFYSAAGGGCLSELQALAEAVKEMGKVVSVSRVEVQTEDLPKVSNMEVSSKLWESSPCTPQLVLLPFGEDKSILDEYKRYDGPMAGKALQAWVVEGMPNLVSVLNPMIMPEFMGLVRGGSSNVRGLKVLLFSNKEEVPGIYRALALKTRNHSHVGFGFVQATDPGNKMIVQQFNPPKTPFLCVLFPSPDDPEKLGVQPYQGPLKFDLMALWVEVVVQMFGAEKEDSGASLPLLVPKANITSDLTTLCTSRAPLCAIALLDPPAPETPPAKELGVLGVVASSFKAAEQPLSFLWVDGRREWAFTAALGLAVRDLPSVVLLSPKHMRYAVMEVEGQEGFSQQSIAHFIEGVMSGKVYSKPLDAMPALLGENGPAYVEDAAEAPIEEIVEEEFDLADIMSEEIDDALIKSKADKISDVEEELKKAAAEKAEAAAKKKSKKGKKSKKSSKKSTTDEL